jgi:hypothetical protein
MSEVNEFLQKRNAAIRGELKKLRRQNGAHDPHDVLGWARSHPKSKLHGLFQWDDGKAAEQYRLGQARRIIKIYVRQETDGGLDEVPYVSVPNLRHTDSGSYYDAKTVATHEEFRLSVINEVKAKLADMRTTYQTMMPELEPVWAAIGKSCTT